MHTQKHTQSKHSDMAQHYLAITKSSPKTNKSLAQAFMSIKVHLIRTHTQMKQNIKQSNLKLEKRTLTAKLLLD